MSISPAEAVAIMMERWSRDRHQAEQVAAAVRGALPGVVELLVNEYGVSKVTLFGSLARGIAHLDSDIDLAVVGLPAERYFDALARCARVAGRVVDLVRFEEARPGQIASISESGEVLYDR